MQSDDDEIKQMIIDVLQLEDALELGVAIHKRYGVTLPADSDDTRRHFASVRALGLMIDKHRRK
jgi:acyl carrier protein